MPEAMVKALEAFFINYNRPEEKKFLPLGFLPVEKALKQIRLYREERQV